MKFYCPHHKKKKYDYNIVTFVYRGSEVIPKDKDRKEIRCPVKGCNELMLAQDKKGNPTIGTFSSMSIDARKDNLKKRAKEFNNLKINKDNKRHLDTQHLNTNARPRSRY